MLSIVVPVYNTSQYLVQCIESLLSQSYCDLEIVLVDDGSTDNSPALCDAYARDYSKIKVIHKENGGLISAWIAGTEGANGEFVGYVDSDDYVCEDYYQVLMQPILVYDCDISICGFTKMNPGKDIIYPANGWVSGLYADDRLEDLKQNFYNNVNLQNSRCIKVFRRDLVIKNIHLIDRNVTLGEDMTITVPCVLDARSIYVNNTYFGYCYRIGEQSMSHCFNPKLIPNYQRLFDNIIQSFEQKGYLNKHVYNKFANEFVTVTGLIAFSDNPIKERKQFLKELKHLPCSNIVLRHRCNTKLSHKFISVLMRLNMFRFICILADVKKLFKK